MGKLSKYFSAIGRSIKTLGDGLAVTLSYMLRKPTTIQYPDRTAKPVVAMLPDRSRGFLEVDVSKCTGCSICAKTCPIECIHVVVEKNIELKKRFLNSFKVDLSKCMFCGLCVEACPVSGLRHSHEFEGAMYDVNKLMFEFVSAPKEVAKPPKKDEKVEFPPLGSIIRPMLAKHGDVFRSEKKFASKRSSSS